MTSEISEENNGLGEKYKVETIASESGYRYMVFKEKVYGSHGIWFKKLMKDDGEIIDGLSSWFIPYTNIAIMITAKDIGPELTPAEEDQLGPIAVLKGKGKERKWQCSICDLQLELTHIYYSTARKQHFTLQHECEKDILVV